VSAGSPYKPIDRHFLVCPGKHIHCDRDAGIIRSAHDMGTMVKQLLALIPYPKSMLGLVLTGFILVALVLLTSIAFAIVSVDRIALHSENTVLQGVQLTRYSRELGNTITAMERNARQYVVLGESALLESYHEHRQSFLEILDALEDLHLEGVSGWEIEQMRRDSELISRAAFLGRINNPESMAEAFERFRRLRWEAATISSDTNAFIENELKRLQEISSNAWTFLLLSNAALIPGALLLVVLFAVLITRPIHEIENAIRRLGKGEFNQPITISGPSTEMETLASLLDWLRCRLIELENEKNRFLQGMSHELKTPLASMREGTDLLLDGAAGPLSQEQSEILGILQQSSLELQTLIENLLNYTAWQPMSWQLEYNLFDLRDLVSEVFHRHQLSINKKSLRIIQPSMAMDIRADRERLRLALDNLIANAIKFSPHGGAVSVSIAMEAEQVIIEVSDDGPGIPHDEVSLVFTPFYRGRNNRNGQIHGTGIGLSVVRESVHAHDGEVVIVNQKTKGSCFRITLPQPVEN
jgi:two-component system, NtrC family, sensor histidine kinase GlrK